ncbi:hypothetical protein [Paenibacillus agricola]|uniref:Uncharacterized protein n=1 Tax=Paenibacillus agricola TaxID=2716264 RepID=A0ABX0JGT8_9BACL|nr:hypothetical protein [Paenibacillus agricola]NHN35387.1 hypothetical protein [Paenibacillus agricola]
MDKKELRKRDNPLDILVNPKNIDNQVEQQMVGAGGQKPSEGTPIDTKSITPQNLSEVPQNSGDQSYISNSTIPETKGNVLSNDQPSPTQEPIVVSYKPRKHKRERIQDTHNSQAYMIENEIVKIIDLIVSDEWGGKYRLINEAMRLLIHQEYPEYVHMLRKRD